MKSIFEIKDPELIQSLFDEAEYGTLALCSDNKPYSVPLNFVLMEGCIYFHGAKKGRKMALMKQNSYASFSVVAPYAIIPSFFSSKEGLACPATQFFKSVIAEGVIRFIESKEEKIKALSALMKKLQSEGGYRALDDAVYDKALEATALFKLEIKELKAKFKFGQHLPKERFEMIVSHLKERNRDGDLETIAMMKSLRD